jgi:granule-bound starch synthase
MLSPVCHGVQANVGLGVDPSAPLFSFIGRLEEQKGADILLEAIPRLLVQVPNAQVRHLAGSMLLNSEVLSTLVSSYYLRNLTKS